MSWISDKIRDAGRALRSDEAKIAMLGGLGGYGLFGKAAMNKFLTSSMLKNMARRGATSYLTNTAMGRPHAGKGAMASALWSLPFQAWKNYGLTQGLGKEGMEGFREGTDTPWWKLMLGQGIDDSPLGVGFQGPTRATDPELGFMDMFTKDVPIRGGKEETGNVLMDALGMGSKGPVTGYKKGLDALAFGPEIMGYAESGWEPDEIWEHGKERTRESQEFMDELMLNPYYKAKMYGWPGWGLPTTEANRGGIMQALEGGGDFMEDLVAADTNGDMIEAGEEIMETPSGITEEDFEMTETGSEGIPPEILAGIVDQREPLMERIMEMIMRMIGDEAGEMPMMGPSGMGNMGDYLGPQSEMVVEEQEDVGLGMQSGGDYTRGAHVMGPGGPKSDSVNAKLSDGEFVMTAKAVQNAGGGDRREGAKRMYNMMNRLDPQSARPGEEPTVV